MSDKLLNTKKQLDDVSPSFCLAKWNQVTLHLHNGFTHSCHHPRPHKIPVEELKDNPSALHNTSYKKIQRKNMLSGLKPAECDYCWNIENLPGEHYSDRVRKSSEDWANIDFESISTSSPDKNFNPRYLEVSFSNVCNLKCSYCAPQFSSKWMEEVKQYGGYDTQRQFNSPKWLDYHKRWPIPEKDYNPYVEAFWEWFPNLYSDLRVFRITGGEPLLSKHTFKVLDWIIENPNPNLDIAVNSNFCVPDTLIDKFIEKVKFITENNLVKEFSVYTSIDAFGEQAEYIRNGLNYVQFKRNVRKFLDHCVYAKMVYMVTFNCLSVFSFKKFLEDTIRLKNIYKSVEDRYVTRLILDIPYLRSPVHQNIQIFEGRFDYLIEDSIKYMEERSDKTMRLIGFYDHEIEKLQNVLDFSKDYKNSGINIPLAQRDFYSFFQEHDYRRGTDINLSFPEIASFWEHCKIKHQEYDKWKSKKGQKVG